MDQEQSALVKPDYDQLPKSMRRTADSTFDRIYKYYHNNKSKLELNSDDQRIRERWEKAWLLLCKHRTRKEVASLLMKTYNISQSVAYDDCKHAMMLFSNPSEDLKEAKRAIAETMALRGAKKAWANGDLDSYHKFTKMYAEINKLDSEESNGVEGFLKKLKPHAITIVADATELQKAAEKLREEVIEDIEHEDLS